ncbi:hypothetical protein [Rathayibacter rathayi]|uniref:hypothetical protein n=1 Tax=Rathayibacter rathayi TaxID=33887 RepID=UPI000CE8AB58|nr:hypothetical protein [Rathayibacter rathayi]PPH34150.1 hypothetical protein C5C28_10090 [Rathayibacter rathayi]
MTEIRNFVIELAHFLGLVWSQTWRWSIRRRRNLLATLGVIAAALIVSSIVAQSGGTPRAAVASTPTPTPTITYSQVQAQAVPTAVSSPTTATESPTPAPEPIAPEINAQDAASVAQTWATTYFTRPEASSIAWKKILDPYLDGALVDQLDSVTFEGNGPLVGKTPTSVTDVGLHDASQGAGIDTPVRWSRNADITVHASDGTTVVLSYALELNLSADGWVIVQAQQTSWKVA